MFKSKTNKEDWYSEINKLKNYAIRSKLLEQIYTISWRAKDALSEDSMEDKKEIILLDKIINLVNYYKEEIEKENDK